MFNGRFLIINQPDASAATCDPGHRFCRKAPAHDPRRINLTRRSRMSAAPRTRRLLGFDAIEWLVWGLTVVGLGCAIASTVI
jgi:hypothetical protein